MKLGVYLFPVLMLTFVTYLAIRETRETARRWRLERRIGQIGIDQAHGQVEIITAAVLSERRR